MKKIIFSCVGYIFISTFFNAKALALALEVTADDLNNRLIELTSSMEVKVDNGSWTYYSSNMNLDLSGDKKVSVRNKIQNSNNYEVKEFTFTSTPILSSLSNFAGSGQNILKDGTKSISGFNYPSSIVLDRDGNIIVVDSYNNCIRKISGDNVTTIAGSIDKKDSYGFPMGDYADGDALNAKFNKPKDAVVDSKGNIFISDSCNNVIRKINNNKVYTFAGTGEVGFTNGEGKTSKFNLPSGITIDKDDNLYVADSLNNVIRKITPNGVVSTFAGVQGETGGYKNGALNEAIFNEPSDIIIDSKGAFYITDSGNQVIRKIYNGQVTAISGSVDGKIDNSDYMEGGYADGIASEAKYNFPKGISITDEGVLLVADTWNNMIRAIKADGTVSTITGSEIVNESESNENLVQLNKPTDVLYSKGYIYICDSWNNSIRVMPLSKNEDRNFFQFLEPTAPVQTVKEDKLWKINFSKEIDEDSINGNILIYNKSKNLEVSITPELSTDKKSIVIKHKDNFIVGDEYVIYVKNNIIGIVDKQYIRKPIMFEFTVCK
ncbi:Ig-like domain-containing protein [Clostridium homopropionicum]|nr:Ig-like domain-containing protein [Clostridium homopropionicum]